MMGENSRKKKESRKAKSKADALEAEFQIEKEEYKPTIQKLISEQRDLIENADKKVLIDLHNRAIYRCQKNAFTRKLEKLKKLQIQLKKERSIIDKFLPYYSYVNDPEEPYSDVTKRLINDYQKRKDSKLTPYNLYIAKLKNTIDGKLYLVVGITPELSAKKVFEKDLVVKFIKEFRLVEFNHYDAVHISSYLVNKFKPEGSFDPFAKFDGCENIIEMRLLNEASSAIDDFCKYIDDVGLIQKHYLCKSHKQFKKQFKEYGFQEYFSKFLSSFVFNPQSAHGYPSDAIRLELKRIIDFFCDEIYLKSNEEFIKAKKEIKAELNLIQNDFEKWKSEKIEVMENFVDASKELTLDGLTFFSEEYPLSAKFNNLKSIDPLEFPWHQIITSPIKSRVTRPYLSYGRDYSAPPITREILKTEVNTLKSTENKEAETVH